MSSVARFFLIVGGLNWGLVGLGSFIDKDLNFIKLLSAYYADLPAILYILMAVSAIYLIFRK